MADDRRNSWPGPVAAVDHQATTVKESNTNSGASTAPEFQGVSFDFQRQTMQSTQAGGHSERELSAGTKPGMGGHGLCNVDRMRPVERERSLHSV